MPQGAKTAQGAEVGLPTTSGLHTANGISSPPSPILISTLHAPLETIVSFLLEFL
jgi:hypothetical protein